MSLFAVYVFMLVLVSGLALPIPPRLADINTQEVIVKGDGRTSEEIIGALLEYDDGLISIGQCQDHCSLTYPTHTYPVVEHHLACRQGCLLVQLGVTKDSCLIECTRMYLTEEEQFACGVGCSRSQPLKQEGGQVFETFMRVRSVKTTSLGLFLSNLKETFKSYVWGNGKDSSASSWDDQQHLNLGNGQEVFLYSGHSNSKDVNEVLSPILQDSMLQNFSWFTPHSSLVYVSKTVFQTVYYRTFTHKVLFSLGVLLLMVGVPMLIMSIVQDVMDARKNKVKEESNEKTTVDFKPSTCAHCSNSLTQQTDSFLDFPQQTKIPTFSPVTVVLDSKQ